MIPRHGGLALVTLAACALAACIETGKSGPRAGEEDVVDHGGPQVSPDDLPPPRFPGKKARRSPR